MGGWNVRTVNDVRNRLVGQTIGAVSFACLGMILAYVQGATTVMVGPVAVHWQPALFVIAGLLGGPFAVLGAVAGHTVPVWSSVPVEPVTLIGYVYLGLSAYYLRKFLRGDSSATDTSLRNPLTEAAVVAVVPTLGATALTAWGYELLGRYHFFPYTLLTLLSLTASIAIFAGPIIALLSWRNPERVWATSDSAGGNVDATGRETATVRASTLSVLPFAWLVLGSTLSAGLQVGELLPARILRRNGLQLLYRIREFALQGVGGSTIQIGLGTFLFVLWMSTVRRRRTSR